MLSITSPVFIAALTVSKKETKPPSLSGFCNSAWILVNVSRVSPLLSIASNLFDNVVRVPCTPAISLEIVPCTPAIAEFKSLESTLLLKSDLDAKVASAVVLSYTSSASAFSSNAPETVDW